MTDIKPSFKELAISLTMPMFVAFSGGVAAAPTVSDCAVAGTTKAVTKFQQQMQQVERILTVSAYSRDQVARLADDTKPPPQICVDNKLPKNYLALYDDDANIIKFRTKDGRGKRISPGTFLVILPHERDHAIRERVAAATPTMSGDTPRLPIYTPTGNMVRRLIGEGLADFSGAQVAYEIKQSDQCRQDLCDIDGQKIAINMAPMTAEAADYAKSLQQNPMQPQRAYLQQFFASGRADNWSSYLATSFDDYAKLYSKKSNLLANHQQENNATMELAADWKAPVANVFTGSEDPLFKTIRREFTTQLSPVDAVMLTALEIAARDPKRKAQGKEYKILPADVRAMVTRVSTEVRNGVCYLSDKFPGMICGDDAVGAGDKFTRADANKYELPRTLKLVYTQAARSRHGKAKPQQVALRK